jgi:phosphohistidine swiveling domain-containing protein
MSMTTETKATGFPVSWDNPADGDLSWRFDPMHTPDVTTPLSFDLYMEPFIRGFGMLRLCQQNYYVYVHQPGMPPSAAGPVPVAAIYAGGRRWREEIIPEVQGFDEYYRLTDFDSTGAEELATELDRLVETRVRCGQLHTMATLPWWMGMMNLIGTVHELTGGDDLAAVRLVQGYGNKSVEAGKGLWKLSRLAASIPAVQETLLSLRDAPAEKQLAALAAIPPAQTFLEQLAVFLDEFGWRSGLFEFSAPTWMEDPSVPLSQIRAFIEMPDYDFPAEQQRLAEEREKFVQDTMAPLAPDERERLHAAIDAAVDIAPILEDHNYYIDQRVGVLPRRLVLAAARRLVSTGALSRAEDVFFLTREELQSALLGRADGTAGIVERRREDMEHWGKITPPEFVGAPPREEPPQDAPDRFWGTRNLRSDRPGELKGNAASAGIARGPARVLASLNEAVRFKPGDVLVTRTTMPPWTPLFAVASAVVTETGGILSHAAVTAREYGLPAVLCVQNATRLIKDGQPLEVDGTNGTVRILS